MFGFFDMYVCLCHGVTDAAIEAAVKDGARTFKQLSFMTGCGTQCGSCAVQAKALLAECLESGHSRSGSPHLKIVSAA